MAPATQNILEIVRQRLDQLRKSEQKVAQQVLESPHKILNSTLAETAVLAEVSEPTVIRFCTAVGCTGYQDFRLRLARSLALGELPTSSVLESEDSIAELVSKIFGYTISSLDWARSHLDVRAVTTAVQLLGRARSIEFFGLGASGIVAADAQQKFPLFGVPCGAPTDTHQQIMTATMLTSEDVAFVISHTGETIAMLDVAKAAKQAGAKVIALSGSQSSVTQLADVAIVVETLENTHIYTPTISRIAALTVIDVLSSAVGLARNADHGQKFAEMKRLLSGQRVSGQNI